MFDDPHLAASGGLEPVQLADGGETRLPALPIEMGGGRPGAPSRLPKAGADTAAILARIGIGENELGRLTEEGVVGTA
jgi:crotonobetainyl-CoA:carnitine CoA-transferase CaiB-like acyl-CoA transferase